MTFAMTKAGTFVNNTVYFIKAKKHILEYLLCYLNSDIIDWYYRTLSVQLGANAVRMFSIYIEQLPIPPITDVEHFPNDKEILARYGLTPEETMFITNH